MDNQVKQLMKSYKEKSKDFLIFFLCLKVLVFVCLFVLETRIVYIGKKGFSTSSEMKRERTCYSEAQSLRLLAKAKWHSSSRKKKKPVQIRSAYMLWPELECIPNFNFSQIYTIIATTVGSVLKFQGT